MVKLIDSAYYGFELERLDGGVRIDPDTLAVETIDGGGSHVKQKEIKLVTVRCCSRQNRDKVLQSIHNKTLALQKAADIFADPKQHLEGLENQCRCFQTCTI